MSTVAEAFVTLRPDTDGFGRATEQQVEGELDGASSAGMGAWAARAGRTGALAGVAAFVGSFTGGVRRALDREEAIVTFRRMGLSDESITQLTDDIDQALRGTTVTNPEGFQLAGRLLAAGFEEEAIPGFISTIADIAQVANRSFGDVGDIFATAAGQGRITATELRRMNAVPLGQVAENLGLTESGLRDMVSAGELSAETFLEAFAAVDAFADAAKDETTRQATKNLGTAMAALGEQIVGPTVQSGLFRDAVSDIRESLSKVQPFFGTMGRVLLPLVRGALWLVTAAAEGLGIQFENWTRIIRGVVDWNRRLWAGLVRIASPVIAWLGRGIDRIVGWFEKLPGRVSAVFSNALDILPKAGRNIIQGLWNGMTERWRSVSGWLGGLGGWIQRLKGPIAYDRTILLEAGRAVMGGFDTGLRDGWRQVEATLSERTDMLSGTFGGQQLAGGVTVHGGITVGSPADMADLGFTLRKAAIQGAYG